MIYISLTSGFIFEERQACVTNGLSVNAFKSNNSVLWRSTSEDSENSCDSEEQEVLPVRSLVQRTQSALCFHGLTQPWRGNIWEKSYGNVFARIM